MMTEAKLKAKLMVAARRALTGWVCERHEEYFRSGWPDISFSGLQRTSYLEAKLAAPRLRTDGIQELTCLRLAAASFHCRYLVWEERKGVRRTAIVHPGHIKDMTPEVEWPGFAIDEVVAYIRSIHEAAHHR